MSMYRASATVTISISTLIEADTPDEALEVAAGRDMCSLIDPRQMGDQETDVWFHSGEIDGTAENLEVEPADD